MFVFLPKSVSSTEQKKEPGTKAQKQESYNAYQIIIVPKKLFKNAYINVRVTKIRSNCLVRRGPCCSCEGPEE